jgi:hypothetical protein
VPAQFTEFVLDLASDGNVVVWTDLNATVNQMSTPGGVPVVLADGSQGVDNPGDIGMAANTGEVAWAQGTTLGIAQRNAPNSGVLLPSTSFPAGSVGHGIIFDSTGTTAWTVVQETANVGLFKCPITGGCTALKTIASTASTFMFGLDSTHATFADAANIDIVTLTSGALTTVASPNIQFVTDDGSFVYWSPANGVNNPIVRASLTGTGGTQTVAGNTAGPVGQMATDGVNVYFESLNALYYVSLANLPASGNIPISLTGISVSGSDLKYVAGALYFTDGANTIYKIATP